MQHNYRPWVGNTKACPLNFQGAYFFSMNEDQRKERVIVYVDGFNFYYGLKPRWKKYYWINIVQLFESFMRPNQELVAVKYFSARPTDIGKSKRQDAFFQANKENPKFKLILGKYLRKKIECFRCHNVIHTYEEKESDVRFATQIVADAFQKNCDVAIVVSADSDMVPAIELAKEVKLKVYIYFPPNQFSSNLSTIGNSAPVRMERFETRFKNALMGDQILLSSGFTLLKPVEWK